MDVTFKYIDIVFYIFSAPVTYARDSRNLYTR